MADFRWDDDKRLAAQLLAEGNLTDAEIGDRCNVTRQTVWNWKQVEAFQAEVDLQVESFNAEVRRRGIASRFKRVKALNDRWNRLQQVIEARADDPQMADVPGGTTGLLVKTVKTRQIGEVETEKTVEVELDAVLLRELREHEKQAAQELGQWTEKVETKNETSHTINPRFLAALDISYPDPDD